MRAAPRRAAVRPVGSSKVDGHVLGEWSTTQSSVALSSGESEFVANVMGIVMGLFTKNLLNELGWCISEVVVRSDSSACIDARSREAVEALGDQVVVRSALDQRWLGGVGDGSHEGEHS